MRTYNSPTELIRAGISRADSEDPLEIRNSIIYLCIEDMNIEILEFAETKDFERALKRLDHVRQLLEIERDFDPLNVDKDDWIQKMGELKIL